MTKSEQEAKLSYLKDKLKNLPKPSKLPPGPECFSGCPFEEQMIIAENNRISRETDRLSKAIAELEETIEGHAK